MSDLLRLLKLARPYWLWMVLACLISAAATLANIGLMAISGWFITAMGLAGIAGVTMNYFTPAALIRGFAIVRTGGRYLERLVSHDATLRILARLRTWLYERFEPLSPAGLQGLRSGDVLARMGADIDQLENAFLRLFVPMVVAVITIAIVAGVAIFFLPAFGMVLVVLLVFAGLAAPVIIHRKAGPIGERRTVNTANMSVLLVDSLEGLTELRAYGLDTVQRARIGQLSEDLVSDDTRLADFASLARTAIGLSANAALWFALTISGSAVAAASFEPATMVMLALLAVASFEALMPVPDALQSVSATLASARRIFELADAEPVLPEPDQPQVLPGDNTLVFDDVSLTYPGAPFPALSGVNLELVPGRHVGVVGPSGSGKSSLAGLALKFWAPESGVIRLGGVAIDTLSSEDLRSRIAVVPQRSHLFAETIAANLRRAAPDANDEDLHAACRIAQIHDFIMSEPDGYQTEVGAHGLKLSGGQVRRIAVAQAVLKNAPILILDEPGEGIDPQTEERMLDALIDAFAERSMLYITHKAQALDRMSVVVAMSNGKIVARN